MTMSLPSLGRQEVQATFPIVCLNWPMETQRKNSSKRAHKRSLKDRGGKKGKSRGQQANGQGPSHVQQEEEMTETSGKSVSRIIMVPTDDEEYNDPEEEEEVLSSPPVRAKARGK